MCEWLLVKDYQERVIEYDLFTRYPSTTKAIANWFVKYYVNNKESITLLKLQCLIYHSFGLYMAAMSRPMFSDAIHCTKAMIPSVYNNFVCYGNDAIESYAYDWDYDSVTIPIVDNNDEVLMRCLDLCVCAYGNRDVSELIASIRARGSPWYESIWQFMWGNYGVIYNERDVDHMNIIKAHRPIIIPYLMKDYYRKEMDRWERY